MNSVGVQEKCCKLKHASIQLVAQGWVSVFINDTVGVAACTCPNLWMFISLSNLLFLVWRSLMPEFFVCSIDVNFDVRCSWDPLAVGPDQDQLTRLL